MRLSTLFVALLAFSACAVPAPPTPGAAPFAPSSSPGIERTDYLIYAGEGSWAPETNSLANILYTHGATYRSVDSRELDEMSAEQIATYGLIIIPGGNAPTAFASLKPETRTKLRDAVRKDGVSYLGFCAGAWIAISPPTGEAFSWTLAIADGPLPQSNSLSREGRKFALNDATFGDGSKHQLLWYGGPITPNIPGGVVARYADGTPAITQLYSEKGFVTVSGLHPAATKPVLDSLGLSSDQAVAPELAWKMLQSAIHRQPMPAF